MLGRPCGDFGFSLGGNGRVQDVFSFAIVLWEMGFRAYRGHWRRPYGEYPYIHLELQVRAVAAAAAPCLRLAVAARVCSAVCVLTLLSSRDDALTPLRSHLRISTALACTNHGCHQMPRGWCRWVVGVHVAGVRWHSAYTCWSHQRVKGGCRTGVDEQVALDP